MKEILIKQVVSSWRLCNVLFHSVQAAVSVIVASAYSLIAYSSQIQAMMDQQLEFFCNMAAVVKSDLFWYCWCNLRDTQFWVEEWCQQGVRIVSSRNGISMRRTYWWKHLFFIFVKEYQSGSCTFNNRFKLDSRVVASVDISCRVWHMSPKHSYYFCTSNDGPHLTSFFIPFTEVMHLVVRKKN